MAACVSALEAELTKALEDTAQLEDRNIQLSQQLSDLREKVSVRSWALVHEFCQNITRTLSVNN